MIPLQNYLIVGAILFAFGLIGFLTRRNMIIMFLSAEMMLQGVAINLLAFSSHHGNLSGQVMTLFILAVAACEAAVALALILMLFKRRHSLDISLWQELREADVEETTDDDDPMPLVPAERPDPVLTPSGSEPANRPQEVSHV